MDDTFNKIFSALHPPIFHHVQMLNLCVHRKNCVPPTDPNFINFIASFPSLEILETDPTTLDYLLGLPKDVLKSAFPVLQEIKIDLVEDPEEVVPIRDFILSRMALGVPISIVAITRSNWMTSESLGSLGEHVVVTMLITSVEGRR
ncbi:hypothetical protein GALMADRAFT_251903 [Galerina marginata CBS 339.88]|uniref:Uncharacterized protein n=1 Tax=Galerina marginata (strain CBS 339.88) TaxID=685588 RepID=A0A067SQR5_GALM3|nr:hypothetical protein GALMADRAFT_251903 [Galerina marginata CBS 339.88]